MGGSGGGSYFRLDPEEVKKRLHRSERETQRKEVEEAVEDYLSSLLPDINDRDVEAVNRHVKEISAALEKELDGTVTLSFGGSVAKHTYVKGISDIDALVLLDNCDLAERSPEDAKEYFSRRLTERFPQAEVVEGKLAVTIRFSDIDVQLLPAVSCHGKVKISDETGSEWATVDPRKFAEKLSEVNQIRGMKVVPTVKLAKAMIATLPKGQQISSYHAESLSVEIFKEYQGSLRLGPMLKHFFSAASDRVLTPVKDSTGQSVHVDDALGNAMSLERRIVANALERVSRRINNAAISDSPGDARKEVKRLFEEEA